MFSGASIPPQANGYMVHNVTRPRPGKAIGRRAGLLRLEGAARGRAPRRGTRTRRRSHIRLSNRSVLVYVGANLNRSRGLRGDGVTGGLANREQEGNNQRICS
jgi:hypothetical protein